MKKNQNFFCRFTKGQERGIFALIICIIVIQAAYFLYTSVGASSGADKSQEEIEWLALQSEADSLKRLKVLSKDTIYPFNPNYISDYKGYTIGLSIAELDRLNEFRKSGRFINSPSEFQSVTGIHDTLLRKLSPYFKFRFAPSVRKRTTSDAHWNSNKISSKSHNAEIVDINDAVEEDLVKVRGIGPYYAKAILRKRAILGAFASMEQLNEFTEIDRNVLNEMRNRFKVGSLDGINKVNVNTASLTQLSRFPYFTKDIARRIITERSMRGKLTNIDDLLRISGFPVDKVKIIALYLEF